MRSLLILAALFSLPVINTNALAAPTPIHKGNGAWVYDSFYSETGNKQPSKAGYFADAIRHYNEGATDPSHRIHQIFAYGGNLEMYCKGSGGSDASTACGPNELLMQYYPPELVSKAKDNWDFFLQTLGDSGYASFKRYSHVTQLNHVIDIDGRMDNTLLGDDDTLDHLNTLEQTDAAHFADKVAKNICADDDVDGVQFDLEPFSFTGAGGSFTGHGQQYFYTEIAKDFAGYIANNSNPDGINPNPNTDPIHCVDTAHPDGRFFSVFTFANKITSDVKTVFLQHHNGMVVDSLYDLGTKPGGTLNTVNEFKGLINTEISSMQSKGVPYQFAIPAAASAHEFESIDAKPSGEKQIDYVKAALTAIATLNNDPNYMGTDVWSWNSQMWWNGHHLAPAKPNEATLRYLQSHL